MCLIYPEEGKGKKSKMINFSGESVCQESGVVIVWSNEPRHDKSSQELPEAEAYYSQFEQLIPLGRPSSCQLYIITKMWSSFLEILLYFAVPFQMDRVKVDFVMKNSSIYTSMALWGG